MADGTYERRGPREAELKRLQRLIDEQRSKAKLAAETIPASRLPDLVLPGQAHAEKDVRDIKKVRS